MFLVKNNGVRECLRFMKEAFLFRFKWWNIRILRAGQTADSSLPRDVTLPVRELTGLCVNSLISNPFFQKL